MFEEWAWDPETLTLFARHIETDEPIPAELVHRMREANKFGKGAHTRQQVFYAQLSLALHTRPPAEVDITRTMVELQKKYTPFPYVEGTHFLACFGHLIGYSAMYYTYLWSLVIAKDLLGEFQRHGLLDDETASRVPRHGAGPGREQGRGGSGEGLPRAAVRVRGVPAVAGEGLTTKALGAALSVLCAGCAHGRAEPALDDRATVLAVAGASGADVDPVVVERASPAGIREPLRGQPVHVPRVALL